MNPVSDQHGSNVASATGARTQNVVQALKSASGTSADFAYLLRTASLESGLNPSASSHASSATGLFQFTEQTWLQMVKAHGAEHGLGAYAAQIQTNSSGSASVPNAAVKQAILDLRKDPQASAAMAGELNRTNAAALEKNVGGAIGPTELYLAHFLGAGGASAVLRTLKANPQASAASVVPAAAQANSSLFYDSTGQPRSVEQLYQHFAQNFGPSQAGSGLSLSATLATSATQGSSQSSAYGVAQGFASMLAEQLNLAEVASTIAEEDEGQGTVSILA